jgi:hypothetical protein
MRIGQIAGIVGLLLILAAGSATVDAQVRPDIIKQADQAVATYRKIIVLMDKAGALDPGVRERVATVGRILFEQNQERLTALEIDLTAELSRGNVAGVEEFLSRVESGPDYRDADKLVFADTLEGLAAAKDSNEKIQNRIREDLKALEQNQRSTKKKSEKFWGICKRAEWLSTAKRGTATSLSCTRSTRVNRS